MQIVEKYWRWILFLFIPLISLAMHWKVLPMELVGHHVWRQTETQTVTRNFAEEDFNILNPRTNNQAHPDRINRKEFPLLQWLTAGVYRLTGVQSIMVTRMFMLLLGWAAIWGMFAWLWHLFENRLLALIGAWCLTLSPVFFYHGINPMPDILALTFTIWGLAKFQQWQREGGRLALILGGIMFGLAALVKLPFILFFLVPAVYFLQQLMARKPDYKLVLVLAVSLIPAVAWYIWVIPTWSNPITSSFSSDGAAGSSELVNVVLTHVFSMLPEWIVGFAALPLFIAGLIYLLIKKPLKKNVAWQLTGLFAGLIVYYIYVLPVARNVHDYYMLPFLPLTILVTVAGTSWLVQTKFKWFLPLILTALVLTTGLRTWHSWNPDKPEFNKDLSEHYIELHELIPEDASVIIHGDPTEHVWFYYLDRKGWVANNAAYLNKEHLSSLTAGGTLYIVSNEPITFGTEIWQQGSLRVYALE